MTDRSDTRTDAVKGASSDELQLNQLRQLLGVADADGVRQILRRLDDPDIRARDLSSVLADAVTLSSRSDDRLGDALEPSVQRAVHTAIHNDPAPFADALYPALAPTIRRAITEILRGMVQSLNELLEHSLSIQGLRWRLQALRTRRSFAEVVLSHSLVYRVEQAFLIHRKTGLLLQHVVDPAAEAQDPDLVSSMLTAIQDFVHDSFVVGDDAGLQDFRVGDLTVWIERGRDAVLAVAIRGNAPETLREDLRALLRAIHISHFEELENFDGDAASFESARGDLRGCLVSNFRKPSTRPTPMLWLILLVVLAALGFWLVSSFGDQRRWDTFLGELEAAPGIVVTSAESVDGRRLVRGLRDPLSPEPATLARESGYRDDEIDFHLERFTSLDRVLVMERASLALSQPPGVTMDLVDGVLTVDGTASASWIERSRTRAPWIPGIDAFRFIGIRADPSAKQLALVDRIEGHLIRFASLSDRPLAEDLAVLDTLAGDLVELERVGRADGWIAVITVVGHADITGTEELNFELSTRRAETIRDALVRRGMAEDDLRVLGVGSTQPLVGVGHAPRGSDRRVEVEVELVAVSEDGG
jgi:OOP family OmpA-OmpF porin